MKTAGIIGGIGPESTMEYYRLIIADYRERQKDGNYPSMIINSVNLIELVALVTANDLSGMTDYLVNEIEKLARAGADFGVIAANTPHLVFDSVNERSPIPLIRPGRLFPRRTSNNPTQRRRAILHSREIYERSGQRRHSA